MSKVSLNNPKILIWAREEMAYSIDEVAHRFSKDRKTIENWESGVEFPTFNQLTDLAHYYKRPVAFFFYPEIPTKTPKPKDYRTLPNVVPGIYSRETIVSYREVLNMLAETQPLLETLYPKAKYSLPKWSLNDDPEEKAVQIRSLLGITMQKQMQELKTFHDAFDAWRSALFDNGIITRICQMPITDSRAFCLFHNDLAGIGLSNEDKEQAMIFSLFHEVCHLGLKLPGVSGELSNNKSKNQKIEQYCDKFAASLLLPASYPDVIRYLEFFTGSIDYLELAKKLAKRFKVSKYVIFRRAYDLNMVKASAYWNVLSEWQTIDAAITAKKKSKYGEGGNFYATQVNNLGKRFIELAMDSLRHNYLTPIQAQRILGLNPSALEFYL